MLLINCLVSTSVKLTGQAEVTEDTGQVPCGIVKGESHQMLRHSCNNFTYLEGEKKRKTRTKLNKCIEF